MSSPRFRVASTVLSTRDVDVLATFYEQLLGIPRMADEPGWVVLRERPDAWGLSFHHDEHHVAPVWPSRAVDQQMMMHLDIAVDDVDLAVARAIECGATRAETQPQDDVVVMLDPDGHPFCLFPSTDW